MKTYKLIDCYTQAALMCASVLYVWWTGASGLLTTYFVVGGWQVFSCLIHYAFSRYYYPDKERKNYLKLLMLIAIIGVLSLPVWIFYLIALLIISPIMAFWYCTICFSEYRILKHKALVHLK